MKKSILPIFIPHLGCPRDCSFCDQRSIIGRKAPTPQEVAGQIEDGLRYADVPQIAFYGGSFTALPSRQQEGYLSAARAFVDAGRASGIRISTRPDCVGASALKLLSAYPVQTVELGAQSMDDSVLEAANRGHTAQDTIRAATAVKSAGYSLVLQMMTGLPGASPESDLHTARALAAVKPDGARVYPTCVLPGTRLADMHARGEYTPQSLDEAAALCADILDIFMQAGIPVIRIGLNPTDGLSQPGAVIGPYHPAFGEMARSRRLRNMAVKLIGGLEAKCAAEIIISVPKGRASLMRGQKNSNLHFLRQTYSGAEVKIVETCGQEVEVTAEVKYGKPH